MTDRFDHLCDEPKCCSYKQRTFARSCGCHKTRETMMLERIAELEEENDLQSIAIDALGNKLERLPDPHHRPAATVIFDGAEVPALETTR